jgi:hypothetical protein
VNSDELLEGSKGEYKKGSTEDIYSRTLESMIIGAINSELELMYMSEVMKDLREKIAELKKDEEASKEEYLKNLLSTYEIYLHYLDVVEEKRKKVLERWLLIIDFIEKKIKQTEKAMKIVREFGELLEKYTELKKILV